jgi:hypothetical protein
LLIKGPRKQATGGTSREGLYTEEGHSQNTHPKQKEVCIIRTTAITSTSKQTQSPFLFWVLEASSHLLEKIGVLFDCGETLFFFWWVSKISCLAFAFVLQYFREGRRVFEEEEEVSCVFFPESRLENRG